MKSYREIDVDETPVVVLGCGHFFTGESLDGILGMSDVYEVDGNGEFIGFRDVWKEFTTDIKGARRTDLEIVRPFPIHPTANNPVEAIIITEDGNLAATEAWGSMKVRAMYTDGSAGNHLTGHAVVGHRTHLPTTNLRAMWGTKARDGDWAAVYETTVFGDDDNEYAAELRAILKAVRILRTQPPQLRQGNIKLLTDCQSARKSLQRPQEQSGQVLSRKYCK